MTNENCEVFTISVNDIFDRNVDVKCQKIEHDGKQYSICCLFNIDATDLTGRTYESQDPEVYKLFTPEITNYKLLGNDLESYFYSMNQINAVQYLSKQVDFIIVDGFIYLALSKCSDNYIQNLILPEVDDDMNIMSLIG